MDSTPNVSLTMLLWSRCYATERPLSALYDGHSPQPRRREPLR